MLLAHRLGCARPVRQDGTLLEGAPLVAGVPAPEAEPAPVQSFRWGSVKSHDGWRSQCVNETCKSKTKAAKTGGRLARRKKDGVYNKISTNPNQSAKG